MGPFAEENRMKVACAMLDDIKCDIMHGKYGEPGRINISSVQFVLVGSSELINDPDFTDVYCEYLARVQFVEQNQVDDQPQDQGQDKDQQSDIHRMALGDE